jgi:DNA-binding CsgD family transcriptional regulator
MTLENRNGVPEPRPVVVEPDAGRGVARADAPLSTLVELLVAATWPTGGDAIAAARRRLLVALAGAVGADTWSWVLTRTPRPGEPMSLPVPIAMLDGGWTPEQRAIHVRAQQSPHRRVFGGRMYTRILSDGHATFARPALLDDVAWRSSDYYREFTGPMGLDEFMLSARRIGAEAADVSGLGLYRTAGRPPFDDAAVALVEAVMSRVTWLHEADGPVDHVAGPILALTPRARQVLRLLQSGHPDKQIGEMLGISRHTVGGYVKTILRHFNVSSRNELQGKFLAGDTTRRGGAS